jgi:hypothetical protein
MPIEPEVVIVPPVSGAVAVIEVTVPTPVAHEKLPLPSFLRKVLAAPCEDGQLAAMLLIFTRFPVELTWNCWPPPTLNKLTGAVVPVPSETFPSGLIYTLVVDRG